MMKEWKQPTTVTVGAGQAAIMNGDFYNYDAVADALIKRLGWDDSDRPEVIAALRAARHGEDPEWP